MIEETLVELVNAVDNLSDKNITLDDRTIDALEWIGNSLHRIADALGTKLE